MTAKQYLRQLARLKQHIDTLAEEIEERRTRLTSTAAPVLGDKVQSSPKGDVFATMLAALADIEVQQAMLIFEYQRQRDDIVSQILELDNPTQGRVLYMRYVKEMPLREIAEDMHYEYKYLCRIHGLALMAFADKYNDVLK